MGIHNRAHLIGLLALLGGLAACNSAPPSADAVEPALPRFYDQAKDPYWENPEWAKALLNATQSVVHDPVAETDTTTVGPHVTIKFTFADGRIQDPAIIDGTGDPALDDLLLKQVLTAHVPKPSGLHTDEPHGFLLDLDMLTPFESFQESVYAAIDQQKRYSRDALLAGDTGTATLHFDYLDGKANSITIVTSSKRMVLDKTSLDSVTRAVMPPAPSAYAGKTFHMEAVFCYSLVFSPTHTENKCPTERNVIVVQGTRIKMM